MPYETNDAMIADLLKLGKDNKEIQQACTALRQQRSAEAVLFLLRYKQLAASGTAYSATTDRSAGFSPLSIKTE